MLRGLILPLVAVIATATLPAQTTHQVDAIGLSFVDQTSNTNVTTITIGDSVQWNFVSGGAHTVTSGTGFSDPMMGALFNSPLDFSNPTVTYTPTAIGVIDYFCQPHLLCCNMMGQIVVLAPPTYPGSGDDLTQSTGINGTANPIDIKQGGTGDLLTIGVESPGGTLLNKPLLIGAQLMPQGGPAPVGIIPNLYINDQGGILLVNGITPLGLSQVILPQGNTYGFILPGGLGGNSIMIQTLVVAPGVALPPGVARSNGHEIQILF